MSAAPLVGFSGSRSLPAAFAALVAAVVGSVLASGRAVLVGCASGADAFVRAAAPGARVFSAREVSFSGPGAFAARSAALVRAVAAGGPGSGFAAFVVGPCPSGVVPARAWRAGTPPSGSWSSAALAAGLGLPLFVFWCAPGAPQLPAWPGGSWSRVGGSGSWSVAWRWSPVAVQPSLPGFGPITEEV